MKHVNALSLYHGCWQLTLVLVLVAVVASSSSNRSSSSNAAFVAAFAPGEGAAAAAAAQQLRGTLVACHPLAKNSRQPSGYKYSVLLASTSSGALFESAAAAALQQKQKQQQQQQQPKDSAAASLISGSTGSSSSSGQLQEKQQERSLRRTLRTRLRVRVVAAMFSAMLWWNHRAVMVEPAHAAVTASGSSIKIMPRQSFASQETTAATAESGASSSHSTTVRLMTGSGVILGTAAVGAGKVMERKKKDAHVAEETVATTTQHASVSSASSSSSLLSEEGRGEAKESFDITISTSTEHSTRAALLEAEMAIQALEEDDDDSMDLDWKQALATSIFEMTAEQVVAEAVAESVEQVATATATAALPIASTLEKNEESSSHAVLAAATVNGGEQTMVAEEPEPVVTANGKIKAIETTPVAETPTQISRVEEAIEKIAQNDRTGKQQESSMSELPKVLHKLIMNGARKHVDNDQDKSAEATPTKAETTVPTKSSSALVDFSSAKEKISQFFFASMKNDDTVADDLDVDAAMPEKLAVDKKVNAVFANNPVPASISSKVAKARQQPKSAAEEARLQAKYAAIESLGERAFTILVDLGMVEVFSGSTSANPTTATPLTVVTEWA